MIICCLYYDFFKLRESHTDIDSVDIALECHKYGYMSFSEKSITRLYITLCATIMETYKFNDYYTCVIIWDTTIVIVKK